MFSWLICQVRSIISSQGGAEVEKKILVMNSIGSWYDVSNVWFPHMAFAVNSRGGLKRRRKLVTKLLQKMNSAKFGAAVTSSPQSSPQSSHLISSQVGQGRVEEGSHSPEGRAQIKEGRAQIEVNLRIQSKIHCVLCVCNQYPFTIHQKVGESDLD